MPYTRWHFCRPGHPKLDQNKNLQEMPLESTKPIIQMRKQRPTEGSSLLKATQPDARSQVRLVPLQGWGGGCWAVGDPRLALHFHSVRLPLIPALQAAPCSLISPASPPQWVPGGATQPSKMPTPYTLAGRAWLAAKARAVPQTSPSRELPRSPALSSGSPSP